MKSVEQPAVLAGLTARFRHLRPESLPRWGTMASSEMLCHLADAASSVLGQRPRTAQPPHGARLLVKWLALYSPLPWPKGVPTPSHVNPRAGGSRPGDFQEDLARAVEGVHALAAAPPEAFVRDHAIFGRMTARDWRRWAYLHTDHHLRQFGC